MRATAAATQLGILNVVGLGVGPLVAGYVSEVLEPSRTESDGLRVALDDRRGDRRRGRRLPFLLSRAGRCAPTWRGSGPIER